MDPPDPEKILLHILDDFERDGLTVETSELLKKVVLWFSAQISLKETLDGKDFQDWDEIFQLKFPNEEE